MVIPALDEEASLPRVIQQLHGLGLKTIEIHHALGHERVIQQRTPAGHEAVAD